MVKRAAALAATAALLVVGVLLATSGSGTYRVEAVFDQVNGLVEGADVEVAGTKVGSVKSIELGDDGFPHVTLEVVDDYRIEQGAVASIRAGSAAGQVNRFVTLEPGGGPELADGATLGLARTDQPVEPDQVLSTLDGPTRRDVEKALAGLAQATDGEGEALRDSLARSAEALGATADLVSQVGSDGAALRTAIDRGGEVVAALAANRDNLTATAEQLRSALAVTASRGPELERTAGLLAGGLAAPRQALERFDGSVSTLRGLVADASPAVDELVGFSEALRPALAQAAPALDQASALVDEAPAQLEALAPLVEAAQPTLRVLDPVLKRIGPMLDEGRVRTPDFFSFFANWADFTSGYDANGHAARVGLVLPPAPTNVIGASDDRAGQLAAPFVRTPGVLDGEPWEEFRDSFLSGDGE
jgi:phospholipid/cholesterol/gamma-HCH transport system substrate-binding protein